MPGPMPPQGQPPEEAGDEGGGDAGGVGQVIVEVDKNLAGLAKAAPPEFAEKLQKISDAFRGVVEEMMQAMEGGAPQGPGPSGPASPEQGGNPNAKPAGF